MTNEYVNIPLDIIKSNNDNNDFIRFNVRNKYNYLTKDNKILSSIWFNEADKKFLNGCTIVRKNKYETNILNKDGQFIFNEWYFNIERIITTSCNDSLFLITNYIKEKKITKCKIFSLTRGFLFEKRWHDCFEQLNNDYFTFIDYKDGEPYQRLYSFNNSLISNDKFKTVFKTPIYGLFIVKNLKKQTNLIDNFGKYKFNEWVESIRYVNDVYICETINNKWFIYDLYGNSIINKKIDKFLGCFGCLEEIFKNKKYDRVEFESDNKIYELDLKTLKYNLKK